MLIDSLGNSGSMSALVATMAFSESRLRVIAENVANAQTPGYRARHLDPKAFQSALAEALKERGDDPARTLRLDGQQVRTDAAGFLQAEPDELPVSHVLFHDGTNVSIEKEMAALEETSMTYEFAATLLADRFDGLRKAIRGTV
jgi:flagellar basal-body rod protein FlgB